jgi:hypothetical protein
MNTSPPVYIERIPTYFGMAAPRGTDILLELCIVILCLYCIWYFGRELLEKLRIYREEKNKYIEKRDKE